MTQDPKQLKRPHLGFVDLLCITTSNIINVEEFYVCHTPCEQLALSIADASDQGR